MASHDLDKFTKDDSNNREELPQQSPLQQARNLLYEYVKPAPCSNNPFFMQHKRELVKLMIKIDKNVIDTEDKLLEAMQNMAKHRKSDIFDKIYQAIASVIVPDLTDEATLDKDRNVNSFN
jgi:hypothetical protein